jgi:hypothetical protein
MKKRLKNLKENQEEIQILKEVVEVLGEAVEELAEAARENLNRLNKLLSMIAKIITKIKMEIHSIKKMENEVNGKEKDFILWKEPQKESKSKQTKVITKFYILNQLNWFLKEKNQGLNQMQIKWFKFNQAVRATKKYLKKRALLTRFHHTLPHKIKTKNIFTKPNKKWTITKSFYFYTLCRKRLGLMEYWLKWFLKVLFKRQHITLDRISQGFTNYANHCNFSFT